MHWLLLASLLLTQPAFPTESSAVPALGAAKTPFRIRYSRQLRACSATVLLALLGPGVAANIYGFVNGTPHLGYRIFDDSEKVDALLTDNEREMAENTKIFGERLASAFSVRLGKYPASTGIWELVFGRARYASEFLDPENRNHGNCRQMNAVLAGTLRRKGVKARIYWGYLKAQKFQNEEFKGGLHEFLVLPDYDTAVDPMNGYNYTVRGFLEDVNCPIDVTWLVPWVGYR